MKGADSAGDGHRGEHALDLGEPGCRDGLGQDDTHNYAIGRADEHCAVSIAAPAVGKLATARSNALRVIARTVTILAPRGNRRRVMEVSYSR